MSAQAGTIVLVEAPSTAPSAPGGQGADFGKSSPIGLVVILLFFVAVAFLVRSMTRHLKRVPESFDPPQERPAGERPAGERPAGESDARPGESGRGQDETPADA